MRLQISVETNEAYEFCAIYEQLGSKQKKIWNYISSFARNAKRMFASQSAIAKNVGCSRKHVNETIGLFESYGWVIRISRGYKKSKIVHMQEKHFMVDVHNQSFYKKVEVTHEVTHTYKYYKNNTSKKRPSKVEIAQHVKHLKISTKNKLKLSLCSESDLQEALYQAKKNKENGIKIRNEEEYVVQIAIKLAQRGGHKLNWPGYYAALEDLELAAA